MVFDVETASGQSVGDKLPALMRQLGWIMFHPAQDLHTKENREMQTFTATNTEIVDDTVVITLTDMDGKTWKSYTALEVVVDDFSNGFVETFDDAPENWEEVEYSEDDLVEKFENIVAGIAGTVRDNAWEDFKYFCEEEGVLRDTIDFDNVMTAVISKLNAEVNLTQS